MLSLVEIDSVVLEKILNFLNVFSLLVFYYYLPLDKGVALYLSNLKHLHLKILVPS